MKRQLLSLLIVLLIASTSYANHITGGEVSYTLVSQSSNNYTYAITLKLFRDATSGTALDPSVNIAIYNKGNNSLVWNSRSEERRVGKECRSRRAPSNEKKK